MCKFLLNGKGWEVKLYSLVNTPLTLDCEGSFAGSRMREISKGTCAAIENELSYDEILANITLCKVHDLAELVKQINGLDKVLSEDQKIKVQ